MLNTTNYCKMTRLELFYLSVFCVASPVLPMSLDCQPLIGTSVFSDVYMMMVQNKKFNFAFGMRYKRKPETHLNLKHISDINPCKSN